MPNNLYTALTRTRARTNFTVPVQLRDVQRAFVKYLWSITLKTAGVPADIESL